MEPPDKRLFEVDIGSGEFRNGVVNEWWDLPDEGTLPAEMTWPQTILWIAAAEREGAPDCLGA